MFNFHSILYITLYIARVKMSDIVIIKFQKHITFLILISKVYVKTKSYLSVNDVEPLFRLHFLKSHCFLKNLMKPFQNQLSKEDVELLIKLILAEGDLDDRSTPLYTIIPCIVFCTLCTLPFLSLSYSS